ncbi:MAG TPA: lamin tail domain-containing protein [Candidatus Nanoarchaeia archaeon]
MVAFLFIFLIFLFLAPGVYAAERVVINELVPNPQEGKEWVEFYNPSPVSISLDGWVLEEKTGSSLTGTKQHQISLLTVLAKSFAVFEFYTNSLNNGGDVLTLKNPAGVVDQIAFGDAPNPKLDAPTKGKSLARTPDGSESWAILDSPTKNSSNPAQPPTGASTQTKQTGSLALSEILPNPEKGGKEWVEIFNPNNSKVTLAGWQLVDAANHKKELAESVAGGSYKVFYYSSGWLNNSGDELKLVNPTGKQVEKYNFGASEKDTSFAKDSTGKWKITTTPTPGKPNKITGEGSTQTLVDTSSDNDGASTIGSTGLDSTLDYLSGTFAFDEAGDEAITGDNGKVAGVNERTDQKNSLSTLLIAAGVAFIGTAIVWPFLERKKIL